MNASLLWLIEAGLQVSSPNRAIEGATLAEATELIEKLRKRLDHYDIL
jgi:hypothetical protein